MAVREISWDEVLEAGTVIFGQRFSAAARSGGWHGELKAAYRRRALETHPDRAQHLGRSEAELAAEFRSVAAAYELLAAMRAGAAPRPAERAASRPERSSTAQGEAPRRTRAERPARPGATWTQGRGTDRSEGSESRAESRADRREDGPSAPGTGRAGASWTAGRTGHGGSAWSGPRTANTWTAGARTAEARTAERRTPGPRAAEPRTAGPRTTDARAAEPRTAGPRTTDARAAEPRTAERRTADARAAEPRTAEPRTTGTEASSEPAAFAKRLWRAGLPSRRLRLAEFLYYSGRLPWVDFVAAISWQRRQRPEVGRIAVDFGFLERHQVLEILTRRRIEQALAVPFGEFAVRHGYLTSFQVLAVLGQQLRLQRPLGQYFVERGLVSEPELDEVRLRVLRHNARWAA